MFKLYDVLRDVRLEHDASRLKSSMKLCDMSRVRRHGYKFGEKKFMLSIWVYEMVRFLR